MLAAHRGQAVRERGAGKGDIAGDCHGTAQQPSEAVLRYAKLPPELAAVPAKARAEELKIGGGHRPRPWFFPPHEHSHFMVRPVAFRQRSSQTCLEGLLE